MNMYTPSLVCFILLLAKGQVLGYDCNENIPKNRQQVLLEAIDLRREPIPYIANLPNLTYSCALATEAHSRLGMKR
uniref:Activation associated secreted protein n=1 Tax=Ostertagia ostertagi TaxID=6317 RepID=A5I8F0_OSTOS|nr:activation associated secreted protein [Ostertagia ostertagi]